MLPETIQNKSYIRWLLQYILNTTHSLDVLSESAIFIYFFGYYLPAYIRTAHYHLSFSSHNEIYASSALGETFNSQRFRFLSI